MKKQKFLKRVLALGMSALMTISMIPHMGAPLTVNAEEPGWEKNVVGIGTSIIKNPTKGNCGWSYVYYGKYDGENPTKYRVLLNKTNTFSKDDTSVYTMFLDCDSILMRSKFDNSTNVWSDSYLKSMLNGSSFLNKTGCFTDREKSAIANSKKTIESSFETESQNSYFASLLGEKIFVLDAVEAHCETYGYEKAVTESKNLGLYKPVAFENYTTDDKYYYLRSKTKVVHDPPYASTIYAGSPTYVQTMASFVGESYVRGVSPAFNVKLSSILFSSLISGTAGQSGAEYKLTLSDSNMVFNKTTTPSVNDGVLSFEYSITGSDKDKANHISVVYTDKDYTESDAKVLGYDQYALDGLTGTININIPDDYVGGRKIYVFAEEVNDEKETDYASNLVDVTINHDTHDFTYAAGEGDESNMIIATCGTSYCTLPDSKVKLALTAPENLAYDGSAKEVTITGYPEEAVPGLAAAPDSGVTYFNANESGSTETVGEPLEGAPTDVGSYVAQFTWQEKTASLPFDITKREVTITGITSTDKTYDGTKTAVVDCTNAIIADAVTGDDISVEATGEYSDAAAEAGKTVTLSLSLVGDDADNYNISSGSQTIATSDIEPLEAEFTWGDTEFTYDGTAKLPTATVSNLVTVGETTDTCDVTVTGEQTNANKDNETYTATVTSISNTNYKLPDEAVTTEFTIAKAAAAATVNAVDDISYDYNDHELVSVEAESLKGGTVKYRLGENGDWSDDVPTGDIPGTYNTYYYVKADDSGNYKDNGSEEEPLGPCETNIVAGSFEGITADSYEGKYDGNSHGITVNVDRSKYPDAVVTYSDTEDGNYSKIAIEYEDVTEGAKTVYYKVSADYIDEVKGSATVTINPRDMKGVEAEGVTKDYDGTAASISVSVSEPAAYEITYKGPEDEDYTETNPEFTLPGEYTVAYKITGKNYADTEGTAKITINALDYEEGDITVTPYEGTFDYKGHCFTVNVPEKYKDAKVLYSATEDGTYSEKPLSIVDVTNEAVTGYYKVVCDGYSDFKGSSTINITPKDMTVSSSDKVVEYTGSVPARINLSVLEPNSGATILYKGPDDEDFKPENPAFLLPGKYTVEYKITHPNFNEYTGSNTVEVKTSTFDNDAITVTNYSGVYDGQPHHALVTVDETKYPNATVEYCATEKGEYTADPIDFTNVIYGKRIYYKVSGVGYYDKIGIATVEITEKDMTVEASGVEKIYDGDSAKISVSVTEPTGATVEYKGPEDSSYSSVNPEFTLPGEYEVAYRVTDDNYNTYTGKAVVKITAATMTGITVDSYSAVYDGQPHSISVNGTDNYLGAEVTFSTKQNGTYTSEPITFTDVTDTTVYFKVDCEGYSTIKGTGKITINPVSITVTPTVGQSKTYGDDDPVFTYSFDTTKLVGDETLRGALSRQNGSKVGEYNFVTGTLSTLNKNYDVKLEDGASGFKINPKEVSIGWSNMVLEVKDEAQAPSAVIETKLVSGDDVKVEVSGAKTEVGIFTATASLSGRDAGNYVISEDSKTVSFEIVDKSTLSDSISEAQGYYDGIKDGYPEISEALKEAIADAEAVANNAEADQDAIDDAIDALKGALDKAKADVETTDKETEAKNKEAFKNQQTEAKGEIDKLANAGDSDASKKLIADAKADVDKLTYDTAKTPEENKKAIDAIVALAKTALEAQRKKDADTKAAEDAKKAAEETKKAEAAKKAAEDLEAGKKAAEAALLEKTVASVKGKAIKVSWKKVDVADGYEVYAKYVGKAASEPAVVIDSNATTTASVTKINGKSLDLKKYYCVYVTAYKLVDGQKVTLAESMKLYLAGSKSKSFANVKSMKLKKSKISVKAGKTAQVKATVKLTKSKKKPLPKKVCAKFRYRSSDESIAIVTSTGKIKGVNAGTCSVYVYSANGLSKVVKVTVK